MAPPLVACSSERVRRAGEYQSIGLVRRRAGLSRPVTSMATAGPVWSDRAPSRVRPRDRHLPRDPLLLPGPATNQRAVRNRPWTKRTLRATDVLFGTQKTG